MRALSIRQPWAWMIVHGWKDIENRGWPTGFRGRFLVHASAGMTHDEYIDACFLARRIRGELMTDGFPCFEDVQRGGIVGSVEFVDCVSESASPWFFGRFGFVLRNPRLVTFRPFKGQLGFFDVPEVYAT